MLRLSGSHQKLGEGDGLDSPLEPLEGTNPTDTLGMLKTADF